MIIPYEDLERHFKTPKNFGENGVFHNVKRLPRKQKKKWKPILKRYEHMDLGQVLWFIQGITNNNYNRFIIKEICKQYGN